MFVQVVPGAGDRSFGEKIEHGEVGQGKECAAFRGVFANQADLVVDLQRLEMTDKDASSGLLQGGVEPFQKCHVPEEADRPVDEGYARRCALKAPAKKPVLAPEHGEEALEDDGCGDKNGLVDIDEVIEVGPGEHPEIEQAS